MGYSQDFKKIISRKETVTDLLKGCSFPLSFSEWESRKYISDLISHPGTILDIGCGNGFFLRCLQEWQPHALTPFGIDLNENFIQKAKVLYPDCPNNFKMCSLINFNIFLEKTDFKKKYDFIHWCVWDNWDFNSLLSLGILKYCLSLVLPQGRLILSFYDKNKKKNFARAGQLKKKGVIPAGTAKSQNEKYFSCWFEI